MCIRWKFSFYNDTPSEDGLIITEKYLGFNNVIINTRAKTEYVRMVSCIMIIYNKKNKSCPCAYLIEHYAMKAYGGVDVYIHVSRPRH
jgi:hypothetical protein